MISTGWCTIKLVSHYLDIIKHASWQVIIWTGHMERIGLGVTSDRNPHITWSSMDYFFWDTMQRFVYDTPVNYETSRISIADVPIHETPGIFENFYQPIGVIRASIPMVAILNTACDARKSFIVLFRCVMKCFTLLTVLWPYCAFVCLYNTIVNCLICNYGS